MDIYTAIFVLCKKENNKYILIIINLDKLRCCARYRHLAGHVTLFTFLWLDEQQWCILLLYVTAPLKSPSLMPNEISIFWVK